MAILLLFITIIAIVLLTFYGLVWIKLIHFAATQPLLFELWKPRPSLLLVPLLSAAWLIARWFA